MDFTLQDREPDPDNPETKKPRLVSSASALTVQRWAGQSALRIWLLQASSERREIIDGGITEVAVFQVARGRTNSAANQKDLNVCKWP